MAIKAGRVGVNPSNVDELGNVTVGGLTPEERAKLEKALVLPVSTPTENEIVGVGMANEQIMVKLGSGLSLSGETSPFTLNASGGSISIESVPGERTGEAEYHRITKDNLNSFELHVGNSVWVRLHGTTKSWSYGSTVFKINKYADYNIGRVVPAQYFSAFYDTVDSGGRLFTQSSGNTPTDGTEIIIDLYKNN